jgi:hypothetical protein
MSYELDHPGPRFDIWLAVRRRASPLIAPGSTDFGHWKYRVFSQTWPDGPVFELLRVLVLGIQVSETNVVRNRR